MSKLFYISSTQFNAVENSVIVFVVGKNRLYPAYSVSSSETDDSPVHNSNKKAKGLQYLPSSSSSSTPHQYILPYKPIQPQQQQQQQLTLSSGTGALNTSSVAAIGLNQLKSSDAASDATHIDGDSTVLGRKKTSSLIHNGEFIDDLILPCNCLFC